MKDLPTAKDTVTGIPISRVTDGEGIHLLPYYTANCLSADGNFVCCTRNVAEKAQAWIYRTDKHEGKQVSNVKEGILDESVAFHPSKSLLFYASEMGLYKYDLAKEETMELFQCSESFRIKSEISVSEDYVIFWIYEVVNISSAKYSELDIGGFHSLRNCKSYIIAVELVTNKIHVVWGDTAPLTHPVIDPTEQQVVLYANQGQRERLQELFTVPLHSRDNIHATKLYHATKQRPIYVGHSFFTFDGWVGTQLIEFGGEQPDGSVPDMVDYNAIIKVDGTCDRRARCPGGNKPAHCHSAYADSWWVGDTLPKEGGDSDPHMLCIMKNNWETGFCQAEPLAVHGCSHERPYHVHPRFSKDEKMVLFNSNFRGDCHVYIAYVEEYLTNWKDKVSFDKRRYRHGNRNVSGKKPKIGPEA